MEELQRARCGERALGFLPFKRPILSAALPPPAQAIPDLCPLGVYGGTLTKSLAVVIDHRQPLSPSWTSVQLLSRVPLFVTP